MDSHVGIPRELRKAGAVDIAEILIRLDSFRAARWYGSKGNGNVVRHCLEFLQKVKNWANI